MKRKGRHFKLPADTIAQIEALSTKYDGNNTAVVEDAVALLYGLGEGGGHILQVDLPLPHAQLRELADWVNEGEAFDSIGRAVKLQAMPIQGGVVFAIFADPAELESETRKLVEWLASVEEE